MTCHTFYEGSILHQVNWIWILDLGIQLLQLQFWGYLKRQVSSMSLFSTYEKRIGVSKHLLFSSKMVDQEIFPKPFSSCLEDDPFMIRIIITDYSSSFLILFSFQVKETSSDTRSVWNLIVHSTKLYHGTGYCYHFSLTKLHIKWWGKHLRWISILVLMS